MTSKNGHGNMLILHWQVALIWEATKPNTASATALQKSKYSCSCTCTYITCSMCTDSTKLSSVQLQLIITSPRRRCFGPVRLPLNRFNLFLISSETVFFLNKFFRIHLNSSKILQSERSQIANATPPIVNQAPTPSRPPQPPGAMRRTVLLCFIDSN